MDKNVDKYESMQYCKKLNCDVSIFDCISTALT